MSNVQVVFDKVISAGIYSKTKQVLMCHALKQAQQEGVITSTERSIARGEINDYICGFGSLGGFLDYKGSSFDFETRLVIYKDWANKPTFKSNK